MLSAKEAYKISQKNRKNILTYLEKIERDINTRVLYGFSYIYVEADELGFTKEKVEETIKILKDNGYKVEPWGESFEIRWDV